MGIGILLADSRGHIMSRRSGERSCSACWTRSNWRRARCMTRTISGPTLSGPRSLRRVRTVVAEPEHFADALGKMACAASPVTDADGQLIGVLDLTCAARDFNPLMLPLVKHAAAEITAELAAGRLATMPAQRTVLRQRQRALSSAAMASTTLRWPRDSAARRCG